MLKLYSAPRTRSLRIAWLLEELAQPYEIIQSTFVPTTDKFFIQSTPTGKYPTIDDDGFIMFESGAIIEYLLEKFAPGSLMPPAGTREKGQCLQWMHFADATAFSPLGIVIWLSVYRDDAANHPALVEDARLRAKTGLQLLENHLADKTWLLEEQFTAADIMMGFTLMAASLLGIVDPDSNLSRYLDRLQARPALQIALTKTGGFQAA